MSDRYEASLMEQVECICPKCRIVHKVNMYWTGSGKPRKYCKIHENLRYSSGDEPGDSHGRRIRPAGLEP